MQRRGEGRASVNWVTLPHRVEQAPLQRLLGANALAGDHHHGALDADEAWQPLRA